MKVQKLFTKVAAVLYMLSPGVYSAMPVLISLSLSKFASFLVQKRFHFNENGIKQLECDIEFIQRWITECQIIPER